jgi:hypothetical protein
VSSFNLDKSSEKESDLIVSMQSKPDFNFTCRSCNAKLLAVRIPPPFRQGETRVSTLL